MGALLAATMTVTSAANAAPFETGTGLIPNGKLCPHSSQTNLQWLLPKSDFSFLVM